MRCQILICLGWGVLVGRAAILEASLEDWELNLIPPCEGWELLSVGTSLPSRERFQGGC